MPEADGAEPAHDLARLIGTLDRHGVDYLLAGGAARAYGAKRLTEDADCVVRRERANLDRLAGAMRELNAHLGVEGMTDEEARQLPVQLDGEGFTIHAAGLDDIITAKGHADRPKDHEALPELRAIRDASETPSVADALREAYPHGPGHQGRPTGPVTRPRRQRAVTMT